MGIPTTMFTVMFTLGRLPGWIAHYIEQCKQPGGYRIHRPRQIYTGPTERTFEDRGTRHLRANSTPGMRAPILNRR